ncbi:MAG: type IV secretory system conjugative DNA transfer family protein [Pyrinomonadaceae bacterium]|nr:type IV secretory system conjugative DNA transfer family protein [Pyrinomonadaceae bacterium]
MSDPLADPTLISHPLGDPIWWIGGSLLVSLGVAALGRRKMKSGADSSHGSAGWAEPKDVTDLLVTNKRPPAPGALMLGPSPFSRHQRLEINRELANRHLIIIGPPGSGKGRGFFLWNCAHYRGSFLYSDPKSEGWHLTSGYRQHPIRYAPRDPNRSAAFNWIPLCGTDSHLTLLLARAMMTSDENGHGHPFFTRADTAFLASVFAHASTFPTPTPAAAYDFLTSHAGDSLTHALLASPNMVARQFATIFSQADPKLRSSIIIGVATQLVWLADERLRRFTSSTFEPPDFGALRRRETSIYWCLSESDVAVLKPLSTVFFTLALYQIKEADGDVPVNFLLDEIANIGQLPNFEVEVAVLRGRGIGLTLGAQSASQLELVYGRAAAQVILDSINTTIVLAGLDYDSAHYVARALGEGTFAEERRGSSTKGKLLGTPTITKHIHKHARALLTADELRRIGDREQVVITTNQRPLRTGRFWYEAAPQTAQVSGCGAAQTMEFTAGVNHPKMPEGSDEPPPVPEKLRHLQQQH